MRLLLKALKLVNVWMQSVSSPVSQDVAVLPVTPLMIWQEACDSSCAPVPQFVSCTSVCDLKVQV